MSSIDLGIPGLTNIERIGAGGNAIVYRARQDDLDRDVVVKVLTSADAAATRRRFDRERRAMGRLSQAQGIAPVYGSGFTPSGQPYLLMPFYAQGTLQDALDRNGALPPERVRDIGVTVAKAIQTAHDKGVLHRDLKPANILIRNSGQPDVADFGIAHLTDDSLGTSQALTMTPLYTAPEVFDGVESGATTDVYSVGATLFALLNGYPAFSDPDGTTPVLTLIRRINTDPLPDLPETTPDDLVEILHRAMAKNPGERQATAGQLASELAAADLAPPKSRRRKRRSRQNGPVTAAAQPTLAPSGGAPTEVGRSSGPIHGAATPPVPPSRKRSPVMVGAVVAVLIAAIVGAAAAFFLLDRSEGADGPEPTPAATSTPVGDPTPVATPSGTTAPTPQPSTTAAPGATPTAGPSFNLAAAAQVANTVLVRVEAYACTGADVATGVLLNNGIIVTEERVLESPWHVEVRVGGEILTASPRVSNAAEGLGFVTIEDSGQFDEIPGTVAEVGDRVALVGADGRPVLAAITAADAASGVLTAEVVHAGSGNAVEPLDAVVTDTGGLVGVARVSPGLIEVVPSTQLQAPESRSEPVYDCPSLSRDLRSSDAESAVAPAIRELLTMQRLSDAYANEEWDVVRDLEPGKQSLTDADFVVGWRPLRQGFVYPVERQASGSVAEWRIGLIGHETWNGNDLTTLFCLTWTVDAVSGDVTQTNEDNVVIYGPRAEQEQLAGFADPGDLRSLIEANCPL